MLIGFGFNFDWAVAVGVESDQGSRTDADGGDAVDVQLVVAQVSFGRYV